MGIVKMIGLVLLGTFVLALFTLAASAAPAGDAAKFISTAATTAMPGASFARWARQAAEANSVYHWSSSAGLHRAGSGNYGIWPGLPYSGAQQAFQHTLAPGSRAYVGDYDITARPTMRPTDHPVVYWSANAGEYNLGRGRASVPATPPPSVLRERWYGYQPGK